MAHLKLNLGCGFRKRADFVNVDLDDGCLPERRVDLARERWPFEDSSADELVFEYALEQMGESLEDLRHVLSEAYRVARPGARVRVVALHPRHDRFVNNPACAHRLSPDFFQSLGVGRNLEMISSGQHYDVYGMRWGVNFVVKRLKWLISPTFREDVESGRVPEDEIRRRMTFENNVCEAFEVDLEVEKAALPAERGAPIG